MLKVEEFVVFCLYRRSRLVVFFCLSWRSLGSYGEDYLLGGVLFGY